MRFSKRTNFFILASLLLAAVFLFTFSAKAAEKFTIHSNDFANGGISNAQVLDGFGCHGDNISPQISWQGLPENARSLLVTIHDPDAPTGGLGWTHWVVANVPVSAASLPRGASTNSQLPAGAVQTNTDFAKAAYGGPCPPIGPAHRYIITVDALDTEFLDVHADSTPALVAFMAHGHIVGKAQLTVRYGRNH